jgi:branched-chain amino acid transport system substrate-binding protein
MLDRLASRRRAFALGALVIGAMCGSTWPAFSADPIVVGSVQDLTGPVATLGQYGKRGVDIAIAEVNAAGGINGRPIELVSLNSESKPELAASLGLRLASRGDVLALIGGTFGSTQLALGSIAEKQKIPFVTPTGVIGEEQRTWKHQFHTLADFNDAAKVMLDYAKKKNFKKLGLIRLEREYGELGAKFLHQLAPQYGIEIVAEERGADGDRDFTAQLTKIRDANPDFMIVWFANPGGSLLLRNARQLGMRLPMIGPVSMDSSATIKLAGAAAEGFIVTAQIAGSEVLPRQKAFAEAYAKAYPESPEPNTFEAIGYDLIKIVVAGLKATPEPYTREKLRESLAKLKYEGAGTVAAYSDSKNDPSADTIVLTTISNGRFVLAK